MDLGAHGHRIAHVAVALPGQSGGCCDGSAPMCYPAGEFRIDDVPVWMSGPQSGYWRHTHLTIDVVPGRGSGFSLAAPERVRFLIRSRLLAPPDR
ncbi:DUF779 domain-containing protein [Amycolatopsis magusensis]|uniref:DUF779 domain-containing protein n=1 Tax=Amycolatopsis magusensis TaxID=882444 RepID=UPI003C2E4880